MLNKVWGVLDVRLPHQITRNNEGVGDSLFLQYIFWGGAILSKFKPVISVANKFFSKI